MDEFVLRWKMRVYLRAIERAEDARTSLWVALKESRKACYRDLSECFLGSGFDDEKENALLAAEELDKEMKR